MQKYNRGMTRAKTIVTSDCGFCTSHASIVFSSLGSEIGCVSRILHEKTNEKEFVNKQQCVSNSRTLKQLHSSSVNFAQSKNTWSALSQLLEQVFCSCLQTQRKG